MKVLQCRVFRGERIVGYVVCSASVFHVRRGRAKPGTGHGQGQALDVIGLPFANVEGYRVEVFGVRDVGAGQPLYKVLDQVRVQRGDDLGEVPF